MLRWYEEKFEDTKDAVNRKKIDKTRANKMDKKIDNTRASKMDKGQTMIKHNTEN